MKLFETRDGPALEAGGWTLVPETRRLRLSLPLGRGARLGAAWCRPVAVRAISPGGEERSLPITDRTRRGQIALLAAAAVAGVLLARVRRNEQHNREKGRCARNRRRRRGA